jgi:RNA polymerase sigma factor (sigma-70 family)
MPDTQDVEDSELVSAAKGGDETALEALVTRHQGFLYNLAVRMVGSPDDAEDVTQEVLVKMVTRLATFQGKSSFRTWLYRIAVNHVSNRRRSRWERLFSSYERHDAFNDRLGWDEKEAARQPSAEAELLVEETKSVCLTGVLLCLDRAQRVAFVLGAVLGVDSRLGGELLETSPANFRQVLSRARRQLASFMDQRCGLVNEKNSCRCAAKTRACVAAGLVDPARLRFTPEHLGRARGLAAGKVALVDAALEARVEDLFRSRPQLPAPERASFLRRLLERPEIRQVVRFN